VSVYYRSMTLQSDPQTWMTTERLRQRGITVDVLDDASKAVVSAVLSAVADLAAAVTHDALGKSALAVVLHVLADVLDVDGGFVVVCPVCAAAVPGMTLEEDGPVLSGGHFAPGADAVPDPSPCAGIGRPPLVIE